MLLDEAADGHVEAEREWMLEAEKLVEMFRETRMLFLTSRVSSSYFASEGTLQIILGDFRITPSAECLPDESPSSQMTKLTKPEWHRDWSSWVSRYVLV